MLHQMEHGRCKIHQMRSAELLSLQILPGIVVDNHAILGVVGIVGAGVVLRCVDTVEAEAAH